MKKRLFLLLALWALLMGLAPAQDDQTAPAPIDHERLYEAAQRALDRYPGPVGQLLQREIQAYLELGHRFAQASLITRLVEDLLKPPP